MRIKTFQGRSIEEVLPEIRAELGPDAVVIGQRAKVQGGVAGFFGTKMIEVTATDRMPTDDQLVELEDQMMSGAAKRAAAPQPDPETAALAERFQGAMRMGRQGGIDVTDDWDPSDDAELAHEYGRVLEHAAAAGFSELDTPVVERTPPAQLPDPLEQAQRLAARTHDHVRGATARVDQSTAQTYAPPVALPRSPGYAPRSQTFGASVQDTPMQGYDPAAVPARADAAATVDAALRQDLSLPAAHHPGGLRNGDDISSALDAAVEMIDLKAMAALRNAMHVSRRLDQHATVAAIDADIEADVARITEQFAASGVDDDVIETLVDTAVRHRRPFGGEQDMTKLIRSLVEETIDVRSGFPRLGRAYRTAVVGPTSSGKTTVVAKLANGYRAAGMQVGIISLVSAEPGIAITGDSRFQGLDVDVRYAATPDQALHAIDALSAHDLVLVDTPGTAYLDRATFRQVQGCLDTLGVDDVHVVMPLATSSREARALVDAFRPLGANRLIVSRIDESRYVGQLLNFGFRLGMPMTFLSEGPGVHSAIRAASAREIAARVLPIEHRPVH